jgi:hypothetical protein
LIFTNRASRMRVHLAMTRINHQPLIIRLLNKLFKQFFPQASVTPTAKTTLRIFPITKVRRQVTPRRACAQYPKYGIDK